MCCEAFDGAGAAADWTVVTVFCGFTEAAGRGDHGDDDAAAEQGGEERDDEHSFHVQRG